MPLYARSLGETAQAIASPRTVAVFNRVATLLVAYLSTALGIVGTIYILRGRTDGDTLAAVMAALFMIQLTAGLEPGTVRGLLLRKEKPADISVLLVVRTATAKAMVAAPAVFGVWWFVWADVPSLAWLVALAPALTAIGFITSDARSLYEAQGRYALGIWSKQGSVLVGMLLIAVVCLAGGSGMLAITLSQIGRVLFLLPFLFNLAGSSQRHEGKGRSVAMLLRQSQWQPLAGISVLSAVSGSLDRVVVLRYLSPDESATYIVLFEFISKYWLLAYLLAPIMFARRASNASPDQFRQRAGMILLLGGVGFVACAIIAPPLFPAIAAKLLGATTPNMIVVMLAVVVAINSFSQLLTADLQGFGQAHRVIVLQAALLAGSIPLFFGLGKAWGLEGVGIAWLVRTITEYTLLWWMERRFARLEQPETPRTCGDSA